jgi:hypothetical protein
VLAEGSSGGAAAAAAAAAADADLLALATTQGGRFGDADALADALEFGSGRDAIDAYFDASRSFGGLSAAAAGALKPPSLALPRIFRTRVWDAAWSLAAAGFGLSLVVDDPAPSELA